MKKSQSGATLLELMIALGVLGAAGYMIANTTGYSLKQIQHNQKIEEAENALTRAHQILSDAESCKKNLGAYSFNLGASAFGSPLTKDAGEKPLEIKRFDGSGNPLQFIDGSSPSISQPEVTLTLLGQDNATADNRTVFAKMTVSIEALRSESFDLTLQANKINGQLFKINDCGISTGPQSQSALSCVNAHVKGQAADPSSGTSMPDLNRISYVSYATTNYVDSDLPPDGPINSKSINALEKVLKKYTQAGSANWGIQCEPTWALISCGFSRYPGKNIKDYVYTGGGSNYYDQDGNLTNTRLCSVDDEEYDMGAEIQATCCQSAGG